MTSGIKEIAKSVFGFGWALQVLAYSQITRLMEQRNTTASANTFDVLTRTAENHMGGITGTVFDAGEALQGATLERVFAVFSPPGFDPERVSSQVAQMLQQAARSLRLAWPGETNRLAWLELRNKGEVYPLVKDLAARLGLHPSDSLASMVERGYGLPAFSALWAIEGVGHYYASCHSSNGSPRRLLTEENARDVPATALLMLHAGMGLSVADRLLGQVAPAVAGRDLAAQVSKFVALCHNNSRSGYEGAALEALGLTARVLYPSMVRPIDHCLRQTNPEIVAFFWHGVGRGLYFAPAFFLPFLGNPWQNLEEESADELSRRNLIAGLAWAVGLVNMRQPEILEGVLPGNNPLLRDAFANGVASTAIMREELTPRAPFLKCFIEYHTVKDSAQQLWNEVVRGPCESGLNQAYPVLNREHRLGEIFRYRTDVGNVSDPRTRLI